MAPAGSKLKGAKPEQPRPNKRNQPAGPWLPDEYHYGRVDVEKLPLKKLYYCVSLSTAVEFAQQSKHAAPS